MACITPFNVCVLVLYIYLDCCSKVEIRSSKYTKLNLQLLGEYELIPETFQENHRVYRRVNSTEHIAYNADYGWTVNLKFLI